MVSHHEESHDGDSLDEDSSGESRESDAGLLDAIDKIYAAALSPADYEAFADAWGRYLARAEDDADAADASRVLDHFDRALAIVERLHFSAQSSADPHAIVARHLGAAAVVRDDGAIVAANEAWREAHPGACERLWALSDSAAEQRDLHNAVRALQTVVQTRTEFVRYQPPARRETGLVALRRLPVEAGAERAHVLARTADTVWSPAVGGLIQDHFKLTVAELALLERLARGDSFDAIADARDRSKDTVKTQSKSIYRKMGASGREDAARTTMQLHFLWDGTPEPAARAALAARDRDEPRVIVGPNGQRVAYRVSGDPNGAPFLFLHGMSLGHALRGALVDGLAEAGLTAIRLDRPGYGRSDPPRDWRRAVEEWVALFPHILDALELDAVPIVSHTSGVLYACAAACAHPDRVSGVLAVAGGVPITSREMLEAYPAQVRLYARTAKFSPRALRFLVSAAASVFRRRSDGPARLIRRTYDDAPPDRDALGDPEVFDLVHAGLSLMDDGGFDGFIGDALVIFSDWSRYVADAQCRITYVIGEEDPICPLDWARAFAQRYAHVEVDGVAGAGQLVHHTHWREFLARLKDFVAVSDAHAAAAG